MHIIRYRRPDGSTGVGTRDDAGSVSELPVASVADLLRLSLAELRALVEAGGPAAEVAEVLPPVDGRTEVWASGVTYERSREARVEESTQKSVYELVYDAERPELFFKSPAWRVVTTGENVAIRADSTLNVPEPELGLAINSSGEIVGYLVCNDMSSRSIEGENPLYLPQAKFYAGACAVSDGIRPAWEVDSADLRITLTVERSGERVFEGETSTARLHRPLTDLAAYLTLEENFPDGALLSTGTGVVPEVSFTLAVGDVIVIDVESVGRLSNTVVTGKQHFAYLGERSEVVPA
ncbi:fumarylacetoacetate hydrolase family protein [Cryobacterium tepidiphilum]|uniref:fumarylacetoacetate hydrolase family protein n=1 Tax=Cryobacterium tepidiphilum TaxID=2486026 RepID=UPI0018F693ED|nr:fumarylacetoacetate hydrolase family protein [Cryobacterium tepidiphilum]